MYKGHVSLHRGRGLFISIYHQDLVKNRIHVLSISLPSLRGNTSPENQPHPDDLFKERGRGWIRPGRPERHIHPLRMKSSVEKDGCRMVLMASYLEVGCFSDFIATYFSESSVHQNRLSLRYHERGDFREGPTILI